MDGRRINSAGQKQPDAGTDAWASLYDKTRDDLEQEYLDDQEYIEQKRRKHPIDYSEEDANRDRAERKKQYEAKLEEIDALQAKLAQIQNRDEAEYKKQHQEDFIGETNRNDKTGKQRSFKWMDVYPIMTQKNESSGKTELEPTFGERTRRRNDLSVLTEFIPMSQDEKSDAYSKRVDLIYQDFPREENETLDQYRERIRAAHENGDLLKSAVAHSVNQDSAIGRQLQDDLANIEDMQNAGQFDEKRAKEYRREVMQKALDRQRELELEQAKAQHRTELQEKLRKKRELEEQAKLEEIEKAKQAEIEKAKQAAIKIQEASARAREQHLEEAKKLEDSMGREPLAAINVDFTHDKRELAHDYAEMTLNAEKATQGFVRNLWKGTLFRKYYEKKYEREMLEGKREVTLEDGTKKSLDQIIQERSESAIARFTLAAVDEYDKSNFVHRKTGEKMTEADRETTLAINGVIKRYANEWAKNNADPESLRNNKDIKREFNNSIREELAKLRDSNKHNQDVSDNYYDVAINALARARVAMQASEKMTHEIAIDRVMTGFKVYNAEARNNVRTAAHRDNIDKIINALESSAIGSVVAPEIIAAAVGTASALTQTGIRAAAGVAGAIGLSGIFASLRERNRVTEDRARMMRDKAVNLEYDSGNANRAARKRAKYEAKLGGTLYDVRPASELTRNLEQALDSGNEEAIMRAVAEARVRVDFSDSEHKDLISYSSADRLGDERTKLDIALISAEHRLTLSAKIQSEKLKAMKAEVQNQITESIDKHDRDYRRFRTAQAVKQSGKTIAFGIAFFAASQEVIAAIDPNKIGILEKVGILRTKNSDTASETILAHLAPGSGTSSSYTTDPIHVRGDQEAKIKELEEAGYTAREVTPAHSETVKSLREVSPANSTHSLKVDTTFADNGTLPADGNELRLHLEDGRYIASLRGNSTIGSQTLNYEQLASAGRIKGHISIGGGTFEVASTIDPSGQITWPIDASGNITTTTGETIRAFGANGEKLFKAFRVVADNGTNAEGVQQVISLAADPGADTFSGTIQQVVDTVVEQPAVYEFTKTVTSAGVSGVTFGGIVLPISSRAGLGQTRRAQEPAGGEFSSAPSSETDGQQTPETESTGGRFGSESDSTTPETDSTTTPETDSTVTPENNPSTTPTGNQQPTTSTGNQQPAAPEGNPTASPEARQQIPELGIDFAAATRAAFIDEVGEDGVRYMIDEAPYNPEDRLAQDLMASWWGSLDDAARNDVLDYERANQNSSHGRALRTWLAMQQPNNAL